MAWQLEKWCDDHGRRPSTCSLSPRWLWSRTAVSRSWMRRVRRVVGFPNARSKRRYGKIPKRMGGPLAILEPLNVHQSLWDNYSPIDLPMLCLRLQMLHHIMCCSAVHPARFFRLLWKHAAPLKPFISSMQKVRRWCAGTGVMRHHAGMDQIKTLVHWWKSR